MQSTTLLTHSFGGLVGKRQIVRPGTQIWDSVFKQPIESMNLNLADRAALERAFFWEPETHIDQVIFIAVPHRGSNLASSPIGKLGVSLIKPPRNFSDFYKRIGQNNPDAFREAYKALAKGKLDSIKTLSPDAPTLKVLEQLPYSHPVAIHSLIGDRGSDRPLERSGDGVVSYISSHIEEAVTELVVPTKHNVFDHPDGRTEIVRILTSRYLPDGDVKSVFRLID